VSLDTSKYKISTTQAASATSILLRKCCRKAQLHINPFRHCKVLTLGRIYYLFQKPKTLILALSAS